MKDCDLEDQNMVFEFLKIAAARDGNGIGKKIKNCGIKEVQEMIFGILKIGASSGSDVVQESEDCDFEDQNMILSS